MTVPLIHIQILQVKHALQTTAILVKNFWLMEAARTALSTSWLLLVGSPARRKPATARELFCSQMDFVGSARTLHTKTPRIRKSAPRTTVLARINLATNTSAMLKD